MSFSFKNLWKNIIESYNDPFDFDGPFDSVESHTQSDTSKSTPSCFAIGLAKSIKEEPQNWHEIDQEQKFFCSVLLSVKHKNTGVVIESIKPFKESKTNIDSITILNSGYTFTKADMDLIIETINKHPLGQFKRFQDDIRDVQRKIAIRNKTTSDYFTKLGCPNQ